jgi:hypothetical protein
MFWDWGFSQSLALWTSQWGHNMAIRVLG